MYVDIFYGTILIIFITCVCYWLNMLLIYTVTDISKTVIEVFSMNFVFNIFVHMGENVLQISFSRLHN